MRQFRIAMWMCMTGVVTAIASMFFEWWLLPTISAGFTFIGCMVGNSAINTHRDGK